MFTFANRDRRLLRLLLRARQADARAFRRLYRELHPPIEAFVSRRVSDPRDAEDLVARTFEKLLAQLDRFDPARGSVRMWSFSIARNLVIDHRRSAGRALTTDPVILDREPSPAGESPLDRMLRDEHNARLLALISALPSDHRDLLALRFGEELSTREIAELLGLAEPALRQRLSRIRRDLERQLAELGSTEGATDYVA